MGGSLWPTYAGGDKFTERMRECAAMVNSTVSVTASPTQAPSGTTIFPLYITQAVRDEGFKLDVLSIVVAEIVFALLVILVKVILNKFEDR